MEKNLYRACGEWCSRPDDQRFLTDEDLKIFVDSRMAHSREFLASNKAMRAVPIFEDGPNREQMATDLAVETQEGLSRPTNWSFKQLVTISQGTDTTGVKWLKPSGVAKIHPEIAATAINYGLTFLASDSDQKLLLDTEADEFRAITSDGYGRIWDSEVVDAVIAVNQDGRWKVPCALDGSHTKRSTTLYASDRDVFIFKVDPDHAIEIKDPSTGRTHLLYRGFFVWNSEVGKCSFGLTTFLYNYICDNRIVWGAHNVRELRMAHSKYAPSRFRDNGYRMLQEYATSSIREEKARIERAMEIKLGNSDKDIRTFLQKQQFGLKESEDIIKSATAEEGEARTLWQIIQGATAVARSIGHTDTRIHLERRAGSLLDRAAA